MKKLICFLFGLFLVNLVRAESAPSDSTEFRKTGFSFGALPAIAYDSDLGFQYGILGNLYWYGDGSNYPRYNHSLYLEASRYIAGTMLLRAYYDTRVLIPGFRFTADLTWFNDLLMDFTGFNGAESVYRREFTDEDDEDYRTRIFYSHERSMTRGLLNFRHDFEDKPFYTVFGATLFNMDIDAVDKDKLKKDVPEGVKTLYENYVDWGVIKSEEAFGGTDCYVRGGFGVDTRDDEAFPTSGVWTEALLGYQPAFFSSNDKEYCRLTIWHRQYFKLANENMVFAYRIAWQHKLWGNIPFYLLPHWNVGELRSATSQGVGGAKTMRGIVRNRLVGDGGVLANLEFRYNFWRLMIAGQEVYIGTNIFADFGMVTQKYEVDTSRVPDAVRSDYFSTDSEKLHTSLGAGLKITLNHNFIVSADYGRALDKNDGLSGLYIQLNHLF